MKRIGVSNIDARWSLACILLSLCVAWSAAVEQRDADIIVKQGRVALEDWYGHFKKGHIQSMTIYYEASVTLDFGHWPSNVPWHGHWHGREQVLTFHARMDNSVKWERYNHTLIADDELRGRFVVRVEAGGKSTLTGKSFDVVEYHIWTWKGNRVSRLTGTLEDATSVREAFTSTAAVTVMEATAAIHERDWDKLLSKCTDDVVFEWRGYEGVGLAFTHTYEGKEGVRQFFADLLKDFDIDYLAVDNIVSENHWEKRIVFTTSNPAPTGGAPVPAEGRRLVRVGSVVRHIKANWTHKKTKHWRELANLEFWEIEGGLIRKYSTSFSGDTISELV